MYACIRHLALAGGLAALLVVSSGCGTGGAGAVALGDPAGERLAAGVVVDGFEVLRYNGAGFTDAALNGTIGVAVDSVEHPAGQGSLTAVTISVSDPAGLDSVCINVNYDSSLVHPERAEFHGLLGGTDEELSAAFLDTPGTAGLASAPIGGCQPGRFSGNFATLYFTDGPCRSVSRIGDVHHNPFGVASQYVNDSTAGADNLFATSDPLQGTASVTWTAAWHCGDGDQNRETNAADLVPIAMYASQVTSGPTYANWEAVVADYDLNGAITNADIQRIGLFFGEWTTAYEVHVGDNDGVGRQDVIRLYWNDKIDATGGPAGELASVFDRWELNFNADSDYSFNDLIAADANLDGLVRIYVTPITMAGVVVDQEGVESSADLKVSIIDDFGDDLFITGFDISIDGADDGSGGRIFDGDEATEVPDLALIEDANSAVSFSLNTIRGSYEGVSFDESNLATSQGMTQAMYDDALESARAAIEWTFSHGSDFSFRRTADWIDLDAGNPHPAPFTVIGDPGAGTVFPDDDPESQLELGEGTLALSLPQGGYGTYFWDSTLHVHVLQDIEYTITVDIEEDEQAPELLDYSNIYLLPIINQEFSIWFEWGEGGEPADLSNVDLQLVSFNQSGVVEPPIIDFDYEPGGAVNGREFSLNLEGYKTIDCIVPGASLQPGKAYAFRFFDTTTWSSINKPEYLLPIGGPMPRELVTVPEIVDRSINQIQIMYDDPVIRRNAFFTVDLEAGTALPEDMDAYSDVLKSNGDEFAVYVANYGDPPAPMVWPQIRIGPPGGSQEPVSPIIITGLPYEGVEGILIPQHNGNRIIVDISVLTGPALPGDEDEYYAYRLFNADGSGVGVGTFLVPPMSVEPPGPTGVDWAVNVFDREERALGDREYVDRTIDSKTVGTLTPDVIWVEFTDGWVFDALETPADRPYANVHLHLTDREASGGEMDLQLGVCATGLIPGDARLTIHEVTRADYFDIANPGLGILRKGRAYDVALDDARTPGLDYEFPLPLLVTGDLPPE